MLKNLAGKPFTIATYPITYTWLISFALMAVLYLTSQPDIIKASGLIACAILLGCKRLEFGLSYNLAASVFAIYTHLAKGNEVERDG